MTLYVLLEIDDHSEAEKLLAALNETTTSAVTTAAGDEVHARLTWAGPDDPKVECECGVFDEVDEDDHDPVGDPGSYDGGFGMGSYFDHVMRKDD